MVFLMLSTTCPLVATIDDRPFTNKRDRRWLLHCNKNIRNAAIARPWQQRDAQAVSSRCRDLPLGFLGEVFPRFLAGPMFAAPLGREAQRVPLAATVLAHLTGGQYNSRATSGVRSFKRLALRSMTLERNVVPREKKGSPHRSGGVI